MHAAPREQGLGHICPLLEVKLLDQAGCKRDVQHTQADISSLPRTVPFWELRVHLPVWVSIFGEDRAGSVCSSGPLLWVGVDFSSPRPSWEPEGGCAGAVWRGLHPPPQPALLTVAAGFPLSSPLAPLPGHGPDWPSQQKPGEDSHSWCGAQKERIQSPPESQSTEVSSERAQPDQGGAPT